MAGDTLQTPVKHQPPDEMEQPLSEAESLWSYGISLARAQVLVLLAALLSPGGCCMGGGDFYGLNP